MKLDRISFLMSFLMAAPAPALAVSSSRDAGSGGVVLRANVPMGGFANTGDRVGFEYQTREDAVVIVFSIDSRGFVNLLHPRDGVEVSRADTPYAVPGPGADLVVASPTGVEFVFALAVADPSAVDAAEIEHLRATEAPGAEPYRISGDPFVAANMIAGELVRGISRRDAYFGYTYFYVNERVENPCYLCNGCDGVEDDPACGEYRVVQNFERGQPLRYPLQRGYDMVVRGANDVAGEEIETPEGSEDVIVNFYPYGSQVRYADPLTYVYPYDYGGLWDPFYWYWPGYYPYWGRGWSYSIGWGWGWGWGHSYCSGWYAPACGYYPYYPYYPSGGGGYPEKFKTRYKNSDVAAGTLTAKRAYAAQRDGDLRIAQKEVRRSVSDAHRTAISRGAKHATRNTFAPGRTGGARVKTSVHGADRGRSAWRGSSGGNRRPGTIKGTAPATRNRSGGTIRHGAPSDRRGSPGAVRGAPASRGSGGAVKRAPAHYGTRGASGVKAPARYSGRSDAPAIRGGGSAGRSSVIRGGGHKGGSRSR